jgi:hypothetical protein
MKIAALGCLGALLLAGTVYSQAYPVRPVRWARVIRDANIRIE